MREIPKVKYPHLQKSGSITKQFIPKGWKLESKEKSDLNNDGILDSVMILRQDDAHHLLRNDSLGEQTLDTNPRILAVAFCSSSTAR